MSHEFQAGRSLYGTPRFVSNTRMTPTSPIEVTSSSTFRTISAPLSGRNKAMVVEAAPSGGRGRLAVLLVLAVVSLSMLAIALGVNQIGEDKRIAPRMRPKISRTTNQLAFELTVLSALQTLCVVFLCIRGQGSNWSVQANEVSAALEPLDGSRVLRKRDNLSTSDLIALLRDLANELKEAKTIQRYLIEKASHVVCTVDANSRFLSVSKASLSSWGYSQAELEGNSLCDFLVDGPRTFNQLLSVMNTNQRVVVESQLKARDGELLEIVWTAHWSKSDRALFCVAQDVTERKRSEELRGEFVAMVTHDLKTPIASLHGILVLLNSGVLGQLNPQGKRLSEKVSRDFDRLLRLINNMLDLEKMGAGGLQLECTSVPLTEIVEHASEVLRLQSAAKNLQINTFTSDVLAWGDKDQLVRVVVNLLGNAVKFSPENGSIDVLIEDRGHCAWIAVKDNGRGIPEDRLHKVFQRFEQVDGSDAKKNGGTGLGLSICKAIVTQHGGEIGVFSKSGIGSQFWFTLPKTGVVSHERISSVA